MKLQFFFLAMLLGSIYSFGQNFTAGGIRYNILSASTVEVIAKNPAYTGSVTIPATVTNNASTYSVTAIGSDAFKNCTGLTSVTIPNSVTSIGCCAFAYCSGLTSVTVAWATPLTINSNVFGNVTLANVNLYVPAGTAALYEAAPVWTNFNINNTLGIADMQKETTAIQVYPNPTTDIITLKNSENINQVQVFSLERKLLKTEKINTQNATLDLSDLPKGIYLLQTNRGINKVVKE